MKYEFVITGRPVTKKNSAQLASLGKHCPMCGKAQKYFIAPSKPYRQYEREAIRQLIMQKPIDWKPIDVPVNVKCVYYMPTHIRVDLCNLIEATMDILAHKNLQILKDDCCTIVAGHDCCRVLYDKIAPRCVITIEEIAENG